MTSNVRLSALPAQSLRWDGEAWFRVLGYYFRLRWTWNEFGQYAAHLLSPFAVPQDPTEARFPATPGVPPTYSVVRLGAAPRERHGLYYNDDLMLRSEVAADVLDRLLWHVYSETNSRTGNFLLIHAGAVVGPDGRAILLPAPSGSGKTTLVAGLVRAGFDYLSEEAAAVDPVRRRVHPYPRAMTLRPGSLHLFPELEPVPAQLAGWQRHARAEELRPGSSAQGAASVALVVFPRFRRRSLTDLRPLGRAEAVTELAGHTMNRRAYGGRALPVLAGVAGGADCYRMVWSDLDDAVRAIRSLTVPTRADGVAERAVGSS
jgi:hypothetical protein